MSRAVGARGAGEARSRASTLEAVRSRAPTPAEVAAVRLTRMTARHLRGAAAVEEAVAARPWPLAVLARELEDPAQRRYLVALAPREEGAARRAVVGFGGVQHRPDAAHVTNLAVAPAWQGHGLGQRLLSALLAHVARAGWGPVTLEVREGNAAARALYAAAGFVEAGRRPRYYTQPPDDAIIMWRAAADARATDDPDEAPPC